MSDIVEQLKAHLPNLGNTDHSYMCRAIDEIEKLCEKLMDRNNEIKNLRSRNKFLQEHLQIAQRKQDKLKDPLK